MKKSKLIRKIDKRFLLGIAHRGLHDEVSTENGLDAFKKAIDKNTAFELDVHLSKDGKLIVCHDDNLVRTTSKEGIIEEAFVETIGCSGMTHSAAMAAEKALFQTWD